VGASLRRSRRASGSDIPKMTPRKASFRNCLAAAEMGQAPEFFEVKR